MKKRVVALFMATLMGAFVVTGCGSKEETATVSTVEESSETTDSESKQNETEAVVADTESETDADQKAADEVADLIDAIYVQWSCVKI